MTVTVTTARVEYTGNGTTTAFTVPFYFLANGDLKVYQAGTLKTITTHYTVSGAGTPSGGTVTFVSAPTNGQAVVIFRDPAITQSTDYTPNDPFPAESHERALDRLTMIAQRLDDRLDRAITLADSDTSGASTTLPAPEASQLIGWNEDADALMNYDPADIASVATYANWQVQTFTGDGSETEFTLTDSPVNVANTDVSIDGVTQVPGTDYTLSGDGMSIVFGTAPGNGTVICVRYGQAAAQGRDDASIIYWRPAGTGAVSRSVQATLRESVSVKDFGAVGDGVTDDSTAIQNAMNAVSAAYGGVVYMPPGTYKIGITTLSIPSNVVLKGAAGALTNTGTVIAYTGTGDAVKSQSTKNAGCEDLVIDGTAGVGLALRGTWMFCARRIKISGFNKGAGYGIFVQPATLGSQHNRFEQCDTQESVVLVAGASGVDAVTTTVFDTHRGLQYEVNNAMLTFINATAEGWSTGAGFLFSDYCDVMMIRCDIEGNGSPGIQTSAVSSGRVYEFGTIWDGFTGTTRVTGATSAITTYNDAGHNYISSPSAAALFSGLLTWGDPAANYARLQVRANAVTGGSQDGNFEIQRNLGGAGLVNQFELCNQFKLETSKSIANSATTVLTVPCPTGMRIKTTAYGLETAAGTFCVTRECVATNSSGTVTQTSGTALTVAAGGAAPVITYAVSTTNILVQFNHGSATPTTIGFIIEIDGPITGYTKA